MQVVCITIIKGKWKVYSVAHEPWINYVARNNTNIWGKTCKHWAGNGNKIQFGDITKKWSSQKQLEKELKPQHLKVPVLMIGFFNTTCFNSSIWAKRDLMKATAEWDINWYMTESPTSDWKSESSKIRSYCSKTYIITWLVQYPSLIISKIYLSG